ncbi:hypothetical protein GCM10020000_58000 [Streptomyces olivoverticillatus]
MVESTEPSTATPSAPPTCRKVLFTAEPEPAFSRGSDCMIETVAGGMMCAIAVPWTKKSTSSTQIGVWRSSSRKPAMLAATSSMPAVHTTRAPNLSTTRRARGAKAIWAAASGRSSRPLCSGVKPRTLWV